MGSFDIFRNKDNVDEAEISSQQPAPDDIVAEIYGAILAKCRYGGRLDTLNEHERVLYAVQVLEEEVNNGGFSQFVYNSSGDLAGEVVSAFTAIGAVKTAAICQKALSAFGTELPTDRKERQELLEQLESDGIDDILNECDDAFYEYEEDLAQLNYEYIMKNRSSFDEIT